MIIAIRPNAVNAHVVGNGDTRNAKFPFPAVTLLVTSVSAQNGKHSDDLVQSG